MIKLKAKDSSALQQMWNWMRANIKGGLAKAAKIKGMVTLSFDDKSSVTWDKDNDTLTATPGTKAAKALADVAKHFHIELAKSDYNVQVLADTKLPKSIMYKGAKYVLAAPANTSKLPRCKKCKLLPAEKDKKLCKECAKKK